MFEGSSLMTRKLTKDQMEALRNMHAPSDDPVNHPSHYTQGKIEVIDFIEDQKLGFHEAQVIKYICRAKHKGNEIQDLQKARWYLDRLISNKVFEHEEKS